MYCDTYVQILLFAESQVTGILFDPGNFCFRL